MINNEELSWKDKRTRPSVIKWVDSLQKEILGKGRVLWKDLESENLGFTPDLLFIYSGVILV